MEPTSRVGKFCNCIFNEFWQDLPQEKSFVLIPSAAGYFTPAKHVYIRGSQVGLYMFTSHAFWIIESPSNTAVTLQKNEKKTLRRWCRLSLTFSVLQRESCLPICYYHWSRDSQRAGEETLLETLLHWISSTTFIWQLGFGFSPWNESFKFSCYSSNIYDEILLL